MFAGHPFFYPFPMPGYQPHSPSGGSLRRAMSEGPKVDIVDILLENPQNVPRIDAWLKGLDEGPRGEDDHNFLQFAESFKKEKYMRINMIAQVDSAVLKRICPGMPQGTADMLIQYSKMDCDVLRAQLRQSKMRD